MAELRCCEGRGGHKRVYLSFSLIMDDTVFNGEINLSIRYWSRVDGAAGGFVSFFMFIHHAYGQCTVPARQLNQPRT